MSTSTTPTESPLAPAYRLVTVGVLGLVTLVAFEALAVSTAMPVVARELGGVRSYGLAFSLFLTMQLLGTVLAGGWSDRSGPRGPILAGLGLFAAGLVVSGTAMTFPVMLLGRVVSGVGGGLLVVALYVVVARVYGVAMRPKVFGWLSAAWVLPAVIGPPVAGWLASDVTWRAVFLAVPPLTVLALAALLPRLSHLHGDSVDAETAGDCGEAGDGRAGEASAPGPGPVRRAALGVGLAAGATALQWGAQEITRARPSVVVALVAGAALTAVCLPPLLPRGTLRLRRGLPSVVAVRGLFTASFFAAETFVPLMLVQERGLSPAVAGLTLTGGSLGWSGGAWLQSRDDTRLSRRGLLVAGGLVVGGAILLLPLAVLPAVPPYVVAPFWVLAGVGMGLGMSTTSVLVLDLSPAAEQGRSSSAMQLADSLGGVLGIGAGGAVFAALHDPTGSDADVFTMIWLGLGVVGLSAAVVGRRCRPA